MPAPALETRALDQRGTSAASGLFPCGWPQLGTYRFDSPDAFLNFCFGPSQHDAHVRERRLFASFNRRKTAQQNFDDYCADFERRRGYPYSQVRHAL